MNQKIDLYFKDGCGRCKFYQTPQCKVHNWQSELKALRKIVLNCNLTEELKWSFPVYTFNTKNIVIVSAFKEYVALSFFKGVLLKDKEKLLYQQGENSQTTRIMKFVNVKEITKIENTIKAYILEAIEIEKQGKKIEFKKNPEPIPIELQQKLDTDSNFNIAFNSLTPGKQRGYIIYFSQPKQSATRSSRIEKCTEKILNGKGLQDDYKNLK